MTIICIFELLFFRFHATVSASLSRHKVGTPASSLAVIQVDALSDLLDAVTVFTRIITATFILLERVYWRVAFI